MFKEEALERLRTLQSLWEKKYQDSVCTAPERKKSFETTSGIEIKPLYTPLDVSWLDYETDLGFPGEYPYTRGVYTSMYRSKVWTMRMFAGLGTPEDTNSRFKFLLEHGETGLSLAFDMPTLYGYDPDSPRAEGEVGKCGVSVATVKDMEVIFDGIPLDKVSVSMTINAPAAVLLAMLIVVAEKQGVPMRVLSGTVQADILKEFIAQKEWAFTPEAHLRIIRDMMDFCTKNMPRWHYVSVSGYHIREAGASAAQELSFTLMDGFTYVDLGISSGLNPDEFLPRFSFFFNSTMNFFEEIAKFRAARKIWATVMREFYGVKNPRGLTLRFHTQNSGASLTWQQPLNNIIRTTIEALAAVLGGTQSLHTNSYDEAWALPSEEAVLVALRTQQIIAEETDIPDTIDPLAGSYFVEWLTDQMVEKALDYFYKIDELGGMLRAIETGYVQREIHEVAYRTQLAVERGESVIVGVNKYVIPDEKPIRYLRIDERVRDLQVARLEEVKRTRDRERVRRALDQLRWAFEHEDVNVMPYIIEAVRSYATLEEIMNVGREVFGTWKEPQIV
ncbi:MAG: methylmalonyl-CoA mutase family protein [Thaumarchaeota archaeon]|nr:methylmalonyl-CoA mutase family protein [Candidatus Calditenuaceae archaeon]MCX8203086.1 methylmalonyl-CoA mutase family protein [Nitrososphaeria archaeon]MDW8042819.1 methylmalonyl-CoA mutase family protein [Nitrososphaerota archaeon]